MSPPDRTKHLAILCARWGLGLCAVLAGTVVAVFAAPFTVGIASDILDQAGAGAMILSVGGVLVLLLLGRPAVRARLKRAARLPLTLRNRSAGAPAQPI
jgi:membrane protein implicated in regulation of membrane protease activity